MHFCLTTQSLCFCEFSWGRIYSLLYHVGRHVVFSWRVFSPVRHRRMQSHVIDRIDVRNTECLAKDTIEHEGGFPSDFRFSWLFRCPLSRVSFPGNQAYRVDLFQCSPSPAPRTLAGCWSIPRLRARRRRSPSSAPKGWPRHTLAFPATTSAWTRVSSGKTRDGTATPLRSERKGENYF